MVFAELEANSTVSDRHRYTARLYEEQITVSSRSTRPTWIHELHDFGGERIREFIDFCQKGQGTAWIPYTERCRIGNRHFSSLQDMIEWVNEELRK